MIIHSAEVLYALRSSPDRISTERNLVCYYIFITAASIASMAHSSAELVDARDERFVRQNIRNYGNNTRRIECLTSFAQYLLVE